MRSSATARRPALAALVLITLAVVPGAAAGEIPERAHDEVLAVVVLADERPETRERAVEAVRAANGKVAHVFDGLFVAEVPRESLRGMLGSPAVREVSSEAVSASAYRRRSIGFEAGLSAWNRFFKGQSRRFSEFNRDGERAPAAEGQDAWLPPASTASAPDLRRLPGPESGAEPDTLPAASQPYGATDQNTSEFLAGSVSVNLFLVQSDGSVDLSTEKWTADREQAVVTQVAAGLDWLRTQEPSAQLTFVYHVIAGRVDSKARTAYEPIARKADPNGTTGEDLWAREILAKMGYGSGDRWARSRALANDTRRADRTDWGVNVFVADSLSDPDGRFADGYFAYAWIGGPHVVMTYDDQAWGIDRMNQVIRHEMLHCFFAFDEYSASGCKCAEHRGYLDGIDANCHACNPSAVSCVMDSNGPWMCADTRRQIGWADLNADGADDVVGEDPDTVLDAIPATVCGGVAIKGQGSVVAATNRNPSGLTPQASISVSRIARLEWRADGGAWVPATPTDGAWGDYVEAGSASAALHPGVHTLQMRAVDDHGNVDLAEPQAAVQVLAGAVDPGAVLTASRAGSAGAALSWSGAPAAAKYRVYRCTSASGTFAKAAETTATAWTDSTAASGYYRVRAVDACGNESAP
ncbi:MAG: hypothetical protein LAO51_15150 [Acidobacteriia bacterium]|nr:hypothetical protein [Terriglobia bacterium]